MASEATVVSPATAVDYSWLFFYSIDGQTFQRMRPVVKWGWGRTWSASRGHIFTISDVSDDDPNGHRAIFSIGTKELISPNHPAHWHLDTAVLREIWEQNWTTAFSAVLGSGSRFISFHQHGNMESTLDRGGLYTFLRRVNVRGESSEASGESDSE